MGEWMPGNVGGAMRVGDTVVRPAGPWTPAVHALLDHLARVGLDGVPRALAQDRDTEVLSYLPGRSVDPPELPTDAELRGAAAWLRRYHDAVADFRPGPLAWRQHPDPVESGPGELICHNDPGTYNWIVRDGAFAGMIDWDMAGPGRAIDDVAFLCWTGVPLVAESPDAAGRLRIVSAAYGADPRAILDAVEDRMRGSADRIRAGQERGDPGFLRLGRLDEPAATLRALARHLARRPAIEHALDAVGGASSLTA